MFRFQRTVGQACARRSPPRDSRGAPRATAHSKPRRRGVNIRDLVDATGVSVCGGASPPGNATLHPERDHIARYSASPYTSPHHFYSRNVFDELKITSEQPTELSLSSTFFLYLIFPRVGDTAASAAHML